MFVFLFGLMFHFRRIKDSLNFWFIHAAYFRHNLLFWLVVRNYEHPGTSFETLHKIFIWRKLYFKNLFSGSSLISSVDTLDPVHVTPRRWDNLQADDDDTKVKSRIMITIWHDGFNNFWTSQEMDKKEIFSKSLLANILDIDDNFCSSKFTETNGIVQYNQTNGNPSNGCYSR